MNVWRDGVVNPRRLRGRIKRPGRTATTNLGPRSLGSCALFREEICGRQNELLDNAAAASSKKAASSMWSLWLIYCWWIVVDPDQVGLDQVPSRDTLEEEEDLLIGFRLAVSAYPRSAAKQKMAGTRDGRNSTSYAGQCVSTVRMHYARTSRRVFDIKDELGRSSLRMAAITKALAKLQLLPHEPRDPILPQHMLALRAVCNLVDDDDDITGWTLVDCCWSGVNRLGGILADPTETSLSITTRSFTRTRNG